MRKLGWLLVVWLVLEIVLFIQLMALIGGWGVFAIFIISTLLGRFLVKGQGLAAFRAMQNPQRHPPVTTNATRLAAGVLLILPGLLTSLLAFLCLLPATRRWLVHKLFGAYRPNFNAGQYNPGSTRIFEGELVAEEPAKTLPFPK